MPRLRLALPSLAGAGAALLAFRVVPQAWDGAALLAGAGFAFRSPERWLALVGAGLCLATQPLRMMVLAGVAFLCGGALGLLAPHSAVWPRLTSVGIFPAHHFLGPAACLLVGLTLLAKGRLRSGFLPPAVLVLVGALSLTAALNDPTLFGGAFVVGTLLSAIGGLSTALAVRRTVVGRWTGIGERIAGSWLLTIGLLLAALRLAPAPKPTVELAPPATAPVWSAPNVPGYAPPSRRDADPFAGGPGGFGPPMGTN